MRLKILGGIAMLIVFAISAQAYVGTQGTDLDLESGCAQSLDLKNSQFKMDVAHAGNTKSKAQVCLSSDQVTFSGKSDVCITDDISSIEQLAIDMALPTNNPDFISISINTTCSGKVFGVVPSDCSGFTRTCIYKKENKQTTGSGAEAGLL